MYFVERSFQAPRRNKAELEASIAKGHLIEEALTLYSGYFEGIESKLNRLSRVNDEPNVVDAIENSSLFPPQGKPIGSARKLPLTSLGKTQANRYVLFNCEAVQPFIDEFQAYIRRSSRGRRPSNVDIEKRVNKEFANWFRKLMPKNKRFFNTNKITKSLPIPKDITSPSSNSFQVMFVTFFAMASLIWIMFCQEIQGNSKRLKVKVKEVTAITRGDRIMVDFNDKGAAIGQAKGLLPGFCGTLAVGGALFPINFDKWADLANSYFDDCWKDHIKLKENVPIGDGIVRDQWASFVEYRMNPKTMKNAENRKKQTIPHTGESKPTARRIKKMEKIKVVLSESTIDESVVSPNDAVGKVLGKEHS
ncbi:hypothetical protein Tsubulata_007803 [Turnera subulata]|uniref:DUF4218 domain-containing protein n=1 Tax=Turnera subulata TaxID=218843 RepID=A0A9Q0FXY1_9ROSI|nr:hypothetical protein Tsubulata_007803 [Turnera subulata]